MNKIDKTDSLTKILSHRRFTVILPALDLLGLAYVLLLRFQ